MSDSLSRDTLDIEALNPSEKLLEIRRERDEQDYRNWCELTFGMVELGSEIFHPADILDRMAPDVARQSRDDAYAQVREEFGQNVCEQFPAPIAVPFHAFLEGPRASLERLHRLRDTWESLVRVLATIAISEAVLHGPSIAPLEIREGEGQNFRHCRRSDLLSDRLSIRIGLIEGVLRRTRALDLSLLINSLLPMEVITEIRRLNVVRNEFSHELTKSEKQAKDLIDDAYPALLEVLIDLREMQNVELIRLVRIIPSESNPVAEVERLVGHAQSRRIAELELSEGSVALAVRASGVGEVDRVLARVGNAVLDLSPFVYAVDDDTGHRTRLLIFKQRKGGEWRMECVGDGTPVVISEEPHSTLLDEIAERVLTGGKGA